MIYSLQANRVTQLGELDTICAKQFLEDPEAQILTAPIAFNSSFTPISKEKIKELAEHEGVIGTDQMDYAGMIHGLKLKLAERFQAERHTYKSLGYYEGLIAEKEKENPEYYAKFSPNSKPLGLHIGEVKSGRISAATPNKSNTPKSSNVRPKEGSTTAKVWAIADDFKLNFPDKDAKSLRSMIIEKCESVGINSSTAATQFSKWKGEQTWG